MNRDDVHAQDAARDIMAARAEIVGRRDQVVAEYDERLAALEGVAQDLQTGLLPAKEVQARVRRLLGERAAGLRAATQAARVGMRAPSVAPPQAPAPGMRRSGPTVARLQPQLARLVGELDAEIVATLTRTAGDADRGEARLQLSLLLQLRRGLQGHLEEPPEDTVLLAGLEEYADMVAAVLDDLRTGGTARLRRLLDHDRMLTAQARALGHDVAAAKLRLQRARETLLGKDGQLSESLREAVAVFADLQRLLERHQSTTLLDDVIRQA